MRRLVAAIMALVRHEDDRPVLTDPAKPHALAMYFLRLGEPANRTSEVTRALYPAVPWRKMANLRHLIAHQYRRIDHAELWKLATVDVPVLAGALPELPPPEDIL